MKKGLILICILFLSLSLGNSTKINSIIAKERILDVILYQNDINSLKSQNIKPQDYIAKKGIKYTQNKIVFKGKNDFQDKIDYAYFISKDINFILTIYAESKFNCNAVGYNRNGTVDKGILQINLFYHPKIVNDERFKNCYWQIEQGWELYKKGVTFYGYRARNRYRHLFIIK